MKRIVLPVNIGVRRCTFMRAQRAAHRLIQVYDRALEPVGLTNAQFALLAYLYRSKGEGLDGASLSALAEFSGLHRRALHRELRPLKASGLVAYAINPDDRRSRAVSITDKGCIKLNEARPFWRRAQTQLRETLGAEAALELDRLLDRALVKLKT
jgi:DNA-binding MarR family transcriptional regulator